MIHKNDIHQSYNIQMSYNTIGHNITNITNYNHLVLSHVVYWPMMKDVVYYKLHPSIGIWAMYYKLHPSIGIIIIVYYRLLSHVVLCFIIHWSSSRWGWRTAAARRPRSRCPLLRSSGRSSMKRPLRRPSRHFEKMRGIFVGFGIF